MAKAELQITVSHRSASRQNLNCGQTWCPVRVNTQGYRFAGEWNFPWAVYVNCLTHEITLLRQISGRNEFICEFYMRIVVPSNYLYITVISLPVFRRLWLGPTTLLFWRTKMVTWSDIVLFRKKKLFAALIKRKTVWSVEKLQLCWLFLLKWLLKTSISSACEMLCSWDDYTVLSWLMKTWTGYVSVYVAILELKWLIRR